jgi:hypothetical protein
VPRDLKEGIVGRRGYPAEFRRKVLDLGEADQRRLLRAAEARGARDQALVTLAVDTGFDLAHTRGQVHRYAGLAVIRAQRSRVDEALPAAWEMLRRVGGMESERLNDRVKTVRDAVGRRSTEPQVRAFVEQADGQLMLGL